jgi:hypothetical protein
VSERVRKLTIFQLAERDSPEQRQWIVAEAREAVRLPARGLLIVGRSSVGVSVLMMLLFLAAFLWNISEGWTFRAEEKLEWAGLFLAMIAYNMAIAHGARQFLRLRSLGWSYAATTLALLTFLTTGPFGIISIPYAILGVMSLIALSNWKVKQAIRWNQDAD